MSTDLLDKDSLEDQEEQAPGIFNEDTPQSVYDDEFSKIVELSQNNDAEDAENSDDEGGDPESGEEEPGFFRQAGRKVGNRLANKNPQDPEAPKQSKSDEEDGDNDDEPGFFRNTGKKVGKLLDKKDQTKNRLGKARLWIGVGSGGVVIVGILVLLSFLSDTKIMHLAEQVTSYNMARSARLLRESVSQTTAETIESEGVTEGTLSKLRTKFGDSKVKAVYDQFNEYRPSKVLEGLKSDLKPKYEPGPPSKFLGRDTQVFTGWEIDGNFVAKTDSKFFKPIASYQDKIRFAADIDAILETDTRGANSLVRGRVLKKFLNEQGIKLRWWEKRGTTYKNLKQDAAERLAQKDALEADATPEGKCALADVCDAAEDAKKAVKETVDDSTEGTAATIEDKAASAAGTAVKDGVESKLSTVLSNTSTVYAIAVPLCLIYEGSVENSKDTTDNAERSLEQTYMMVRSGADQMKAGATTPEAVEGLSGKLGNIGDSVPQRRSSGENVDSATEIASAALPQAASTGSFSLLNVALDGYGIPKSILDKANSAAQGGCSFVTDVRTGITLAVAEVAFNIATLGGEKALTEPAEQGVKTYLKYVTEKIASSLTVKEGEKVGLNLATAKAVRKAGGKLLLKVTAETVGILTATELAKLAVVKHMNGLNNGLATGVTLANQVDMGGNLMAQQTCRLQLYCRPLAPGELADAKLADANYLKQKASQRSFKERYLAVNSPDSLLGHMADSLSNLFDGPGIKLGQNLSGLIASMSTLPTKLFSTVFSSHVFADSKPSGAGDYNIVQWGYSKEEENIIANDANYSPIQNQLVLDASGKTDAIEQKYGQCYTKTNGALLAEGLIQRESTGEVVPNKGDCSPNSLGIHNSEFGDLVFRWRLSKRNTNTLQHLTDMQGALSQ